MKIEKNNYPQVHLEECKYKVKEIQMSRFINAELESDSESKLELESKSKNLILILTLNNCNFFTFSNVM